MNIFHLRQRLDTIVGPHNKHTIEDQGCSWTTPLKNCVAVFWGGFNKASFILGNWTFLRIPESKRKTLAKERVKGMIENLSPQAAAGHKRGPPQQTYY